MSSISESTTLCGCGVAVGPAVAPANFDAIRRDMVLRYRKWDPQVGDQPTLAPFPIVLDPSTAAALTEWAQRLAAETTAAEEELSRSPELWPLLGVPRAIRRTLASGLPWTPAAARAMRFDFHPTPSGWVLSEVNADVPGGFSEATEFPRLIAALFPRLSPAGAPGPRWADAILSRAPPAPTGALVYATGFTEDLQVVSYLADLLRARGVRALLAQPQHLRWIDGRARLDLGGERRPLDFIVRFFQAEWLSRLPRCVDWRPLFAGGVTPVANPGRAVLVESKRFPLVWDRLRTPLPTWRRLLPETRDAADAPWRTDPSWLLKSAHCNNGDDVLNLEWTPPKEWTKATRWIGWTRREWVAQRRFDPLPLDTPWGSMRLCVGVYTIDGRPAGMYGRVSRGPVVDYRAADAAVLVGGDA